MATPTIALTGASGKLGGATLSALLSLSLHPASHIIALTSSSADSPTWNALSSKGVQVRHATYDSPSTFDNALKGVDTLFLVSTPRIDLDFNDAALGGREKAHIGALDAAARAGVRRVVYSSLAFGFAGDASAKDARNGEQVVGATGSKAGVMRAHLATEAHLRLIAAQSGIKTTVLREGLYNESWPLYLGYFDPKKDEREEVKLAGDGKVSWTGIKDLGIANALVLARDGGAFEGRTCYLSTRPEMARTVGEVARVVGEARGKEVRVKKVTPEEHVRHYVQDRKMDRAAVEWWVTTYEALEDKECLVDDPTLARLLQSVGVSPTPVEETVRQMIKG
ncbi:NAD(P)-binding protein [Xylariomycetidae sp. FL0641]|nr:NAD(P)-binding protein [Xylariomycetidae sp. FL0641]